MIHRRAKGLRVKYISNRLNCLEKCLVLLPIFLKYQDIIEVNDVPSKYFIV